MTPRFVLILSASFILKCGAHYDVNAAVEVLTEKIKAAPTAELYYQRAIEFRALREPIHAEEDLRASLKIAAYQPSLAALASLLSQKEKHQEALATANQLLVVSPTAHHQLLMADLAFAAGKNDRALEAVKKGPAPEDHTHLLHAHLLFLKDQHKEAATILKEAHNRTKSIVLRNAWLDASIAAGDFETVLPILNQEIESSRFTASYRIRRARVLQESNSAFTQADLKASLSEVAFRLNPARPDLTLIDDRRQAYLLLGEKEKAAADLEIMRKRGLDPVGPWMLRSIPKRAE